MNSGTKNRLIMFGLAALFVVVGVVLFQLFTGSTGDSGYQGDVDYTGALNEGGGSKGAYDTDEINPTNSRNIIADVKSGKIDLLSELHRLRGECPRGTPADRCNQRVEDFLTQIPAPDGPILIRLFRKFRNYESDRSKLSKNPNLSREEKYKLISAKRREIFGDEDAKLVFGLREANHNYQNLIRKYSGSEFADLSPGERMDKLEADRRKVFGNYYAVLREREPKGARYGLELMVRQSDFKTMSPDQAQNLIHQLRVKYFGEARAEQMKRFKSEADRITAEKNRNMDAFLKAEAALLKKNPNLSGEARRKAVEELRKKYLGK